MSILGGTLKGGSLKTLQNFIDNKNIFSTNALTWVDS